jgi:beta-lactamase superfamily II metal-dependent hydrolase
MVLRLKFGEFALLITGDSNLESWKWIAEKSKYSDDDLASTLMHAIHHGSKTAFWEDSADPEEIDPYKKALEKINPEIVVISVGEENEHDLPNPDAVKVYKDQVGKTNLYQTSEATVYCKVSEQGDHSIKYRKDIDENYLLPKEDDDKKDDKEQSNTAKSISILSSRTRLDDSLAA